MPKDPLTRPFSFGIAWLAAGLLLAPPFAGSGAETPSPTDNAWTIDFRYAPPLWQTAICLPDDWQKTLVGKEGALLYDYPGRFDGFDTKITPGLAQPTVWVKQDLASPRVPIVGTTLRAGAVELFEEAFAVTVPDTMFRPGASGSSLIVEREGPPDGQVNWAKPPQRFDPSFRDAAIGWRQPVRYRFKVRRPSEQFTVVFGLCEGYHETGGKRLLELQTEGKTRQVVDVAAEHGKNVPALYPFSVTDENADGWIDMAVRAAAASPDGNAILNVLWIFADGQAPPLAELLEGRSSRPPLAHLNCGADDWPARHDLVTLRLRNTGSTPATVTPTLTIESESALQAVADQRRVRIGASTIVDSTEPFTIARPTETRWVLVLPEQTLSPGAERQLAFGVERGPELIDWPKYLLRSKALREDAERFWQEMALPYDRLQVPDPGIQALLDSSIRNIYQAREIKRGLPAFQVGPTCYRGLWVVDGSFLLEAVTYLGRTNETRNGVKYLLSFQREDGGIMLIDGHWKETGIALWAVTRHARLTDDPAWLREVWPRVERGVAYLGVMRRIASQDKNAPNAGLIPDGFSDGGLADKVPEYTNVYWTLAGWRAALEAARWLGHTRQADQWQREYDDFYATFRRAAERDLRTDAQGNRYLPIRMAKGEGVPPQKAQWAFLHSVFPGQVYSPGDPLVQGNMAMLRAVEKEGLVLDTGWLKDGIWNYFGSFYGHAWLWLGDGDKAARTLYAFGNHASPLLVWREEQKPVGQGDQFVGDMPHNWASAEFIRLVRHALALERGNELHLFEGLPAQWVRPGAITRVNNVVTVFGALSLELKVTNDGSAADLTVEPPQRNPPARIVLHLDRWSGQQGTVELPIRGPVLKHFKLSSTQP